MPPGFTVKRSLRVSRLPSDFGLCVNIESVSEPDVLDCDPSGTGYCVSVGSKMSRKPSMT